MTEPTVVILAAVSAETGSNAVVDTARRMAEATGHDCRVVRTEVATALLESLDDPGVAALVLGAGSPVTAASPLGLRARMVVERTRKPVVVVPIDAAAPAAIRRLLIPLEGTALSSRPVMDALNSLFGAGVHVQVLHAFTPATVPRMLDRPVRDLEVLGREFLARHCPPAHQVELHHGSVATRVAEIARAGGVDLVVLSWSQDSSGDRAPTVRTVLASSPVPVLLLRADRGAGVGDEGTKAPTAQGLAGPTMATGADSDAR